MRNWLNMAMIYNFESFISGDVSLDCDEYCANFDQAPGRAQKGLR